MRRSCSESEESDDPYSWVTQRRQIKGDMESKTLSSTTNNQIKTTSSIANSQQINGRDRRSKPLSFNERQRNDQPQHNLHQSRRSPNIGSPVTLSPTKQNTQEVGVVQPLPQGLVSKPQVVGEVISTGATAHKGEAATSGAGQQKRSAKECKSASDTSQSRVAAEAKDDQVQRQRSSDSFTLSSSPSEGETPSNNSSEGTSHSEDQLQRIQKGLSFKDGGSSKSGKGKKSSKKQSKKSKKKGKGHGGQSSSSAAEQQARSKRISKRRAYVLERIRSDSLTSSDEEHCLGSSEMSTSSTDSGTSSLLLHQDSILEDGDSAVVDIDKLKCHLQRRIMAKKPPATFETPATQPIFHEVSNSAI